MGQNSLPIFWLSQQRNYFVAFCILQLVKKQKKLYHFGLLKCFVHNSWGCSFYDCAPFANLLASDIVAMFKTFTNVWAASRIAPKLFLFVIFYSVELSAKTVGSQQKWEPQQGFSHLSAQRFCWLKQEKRNFQISAFLFCIKTDNSRRELNADKIKHEFGNPRELSVKTWKNAARCLRAMNWLKSVISSDAQRTEFIRSYRSENC